MTKTLSELDLRSFTGSRNWYRHWAIRQVLFTDGAKYVADQAGAYWLIDEIAFAQKGEAAVAAEAFQVWKLDVRPGYKGVLTCEDGNDRTVFIKELEFTDFPEPGIVLWFTDNTLFLPSEY
jgi:hypothetical protein